MSKEALPNVVSNLLNCALSLGVYDLADELNIRLSILQQIDKEYSSLMNKLDSKEISPADLDNAIPVTKAKVPVEIERRQAFNLDVDATKKLQKIGPNKVDQLVTFLKQKRTLQIKTSLVFEVPPEPKQD